MDMPILDKPHWSDVFNPSGNYQTAKNVVPAALLGSLAVGTGGRLVKNLFDLLRGRDGATTLPRPRSQVTELPVEVSEEEAEELRRKGVQVRRKLAATATPPVTPDKVKVVNGTPSWLGAFALGGGTTAAGMGGWYLADKVIDSLRRRAAQSDTDRVRQRIQRVLEDEPEEEDARLYGSMKAAEDAHFSTPVGQQKTALGLSDLGWILPAAVGSGLTFNALAGFNDAERQSPYAARAGAIKSFLRNRVAGSPQISMVPVLRALREKVDDDDEGSMVVEEVVADEPAAAVVEKPAGSPAQQARQSPSAANWF